MILTIGCSFTQGCELKNPHINSWPHVLANLLNTSVRNLGAGGTGNDRMFRVAIEETAKQKYDLVIVQWSEPSRQEVWNIETNSTASMSINSTLSNRFSWIKDFYKFNYDDLFQHRKWFCYILALQQYFKSINQPYLFVNLTGFNQQGDQIQHLTNLAHLINQIDFENFLGWPHEGMLEWVNGTELAPGGHPLEAGHQIIANKIFEHIYK